MAPSACRLLLLAASLLVPPPLAAAQAPGLFEARHRMLPLDVEDTAALALGDLDGDGDPDAVVGGLGVNRVLHNDGDGRFVDVAGMPLVADDTRAIVLADLDGDGILDAFVGNFGQPNRVVRGDGTGRFVPAPGAVPGGLHGTVAAAAGDLDGDGDVDLVLGNRAEFAGFPDRVYLNDGSGVLADAPASFFAPAAEITQDVDLVDIDGDGDLDVVLAGVPRLLENTGTGLVPVTGWLGAGAAEPFYPSFEPADLDGDGDVDLLGLLPLGCGAAARPLANDGAGTFSALPFSFGIPGCGEAVGTAADADGDGDVDVALSFVDLSTGVATISLLLNDGSAAFGSPAGSFPPARPFVRAVRLVDVDGDGDPDAYLAGSGQDALLLNDGALGFVEVTAREPARGFTDFELADLDGDGLLDGFGLPSHSIEPRTYLNDGSGHLVDTDQPVATPAFLSDVELGDLDGDGDVDAWGGGFSGDQALLNDGSGIFVAGATAPPAAGFSQGIALGDVDGDGDLDVLSGRRGDGGPTGFAAPNALFLNDGSAAFTSGSSGLPGEADFTSDVALGDLDGDGDLDGVIANRVDFGVAGRQNRLYRNLGAGAFQDATAALPTVADPTLTVALGDLDGDGRLDLWFGNAFAQDRLYRNTGLGSFTEVTSIALPALPNSTSSIALGDVDGDGDLDAFVLALTGELRHLRNDGVLVDVTAGGLGLATAGPAHLADLDGDGDLDAWLTGSVESRVLTHVSRQLAWRSLPRVGYALTLDLDGPPGAPWLLARSQAAVQAPLPPFGTLRIDPATLVVAGTGLLDGGGSAAPAFAVPASPALVGRSFYWQALVGSPASLTNLEITRLSGL